jgi:hypothetical protein
VVADYEPGDEIYICGFSRGAYAARALAGLIGASGIQRREDPRVFEVAWSHYRVAPSARQQPQTASSSDQKTIADYKALATRQAFHDTRAVKCVAVWDTVGSYGIPAGFGLAPLARYLTLALLGFHDTSFGEHVGVGLHAVAVDGLTGHRGRCFSFPRAREGGSSASGFDPAVPARSYGDSSARPDRNRWPRGLRVNHSRHPHARVRREAPIPDERSSA